MVREIDPALQQPQPAQDLLEQAVAWATQGQGLALASVVSCWGSAPQPVGSQLLITEVGHFIGAVSGGCVEGAVIHEAFGVIASGVPKLVHYGVADETAWQVGLACGGRIGIYIEPVTADKITNIIAPMISARHKREAVAMVTDLVTHAQRLVKKNQIQNDPLANQLAQAFRFDQSAQYENSFVQICNPPLRLLLIGAVQIASALLPLAQLSGYDVSIIDPRQAFATQQRFPEAKLYVGWPDEIIPELELDQRTALVALTHDPKIDDLALALAVTSPAFYIGALGSKKSHAARLDRLQTRGLGPAELARIHGPVGLNIGARGAHEIALSIIAEMTAVLRLKDTP